MNFMQVDEWEETNLASGERQKKMKSKRFTSYEQVTRLRLRMLQNWFTWKPVVPEQLAEVIHLMAPGCPSTLLPQKKVQDYVMNSEQNQLMPNGFALYGKFK
jgi:hypothetical protein